MKNPVINSKAGIKIPLLLALLSTAIFCTRTTPAATVEYFNQSAFAADAGPLTIFGFDNFAKGTVLSGNEFPEFNIVARRITVVAILDAGVTTVNLNSQPHGINASFYYAGTPAPSTVRFDNLDDNFTFTLLRPTRAVGLWVGNLGGNLGDLNPTQVTFFDTSGAIIAGDSLAQGHTGLISSGINNRLFYGIVSDTSISRVEIRNGSSDSDAIFLDDFQFAPGAPDIIATSLKRDSTLDAFNYEYKITGGDLTVPLNVALYWAKGPTLNDSPTLATPTPIILSGADLTAATHTKTVLRSALTTQPGDATHLLLVVDPPDAAHPTGQIAESNEGNNVVSLSVGLQPPEVHLKIAPVVGSIVEMDHWIGLYATIYNPNPRPISIKINWTWSDADRVPNLRDGFEPTWDANSIVSIPAYGGLVDQQLGGYQFHWDWLPQTNPLETDPNTVARINTALLGVADALAQAIEESNENGNRLVQIVGPILTMIDIQSVVVDAKIIARITFTGTVEYGATASTLDDSVISRASVIEQVSQAKILHFQKWMLYHYLAQEFRTGLPPADFALQAIFNNLASFEYREAADPPDPLYRVLAQVQLATIPELEALPNSLTKRYVQNAVYLQALKIAEATSRDRAVAASDAGDYVWQNIQLIAAVRFATLAIEPETAMIALRPVIGTNLTFPQNRSLLEPAAALLSSFGWSQEAIAALRGNLVRLNALSSLPPESGNVALRISAVLSLLSAAEDLAQATDVRTRRLGQPVRSLTDAERQSLRVLKEYVETGLADGIPIPSLYDAIVNYLSTVQRLTEDTSNFEDLASDLQAAYDALAAFQANSATPSISALRIKSDVLNDLRGLRASLRKGHDADKINDAIRHLTKALNPKLWRDENHLDIKDGDKVFEGEKEAVGKLIDLQSDKKSRIPDAILQDFIDRLVFCDRLLASVAIQDAMTSGQRKELEKALEEFAEAEEQASKGDAEDAIKEYAGAWQHATEAIAPRHR